jgi:hypothetical protein
MKRKPRKLQQRGGYVVIASLLAVGLGMAAFTSGLLLNSYRAQEDALAFHVSVLTASADSTWRREFAVNFARAAIDKVNRNAADISINPGDSYNSGNGTSVEASLSAGSGVAGNLPDVVAWTPTNAAGYGLVPAPEGTVRPKGNNQMIGRKFSISVQRTTTKVDPLSGAQTQETAPLPMSIIEIPAQQFAVVAHNVNIHGVTVNGSAVADSANLDSSAVISGSLTVTQDAQWSAGATVGGSVLFTAKQDAASGAALAKGLEAGAYGSPVSANAFSVVRSDEKAMLMQLGDTRLDPEGINKLLLQPAAPTMWDAYALPAYQCRTLVYATVSADKLTAQVTLYSRDISSLASRLGAASPIGAPFTVNTGGAAINGVSLSANVQGRALIRVDPYGIAAATGSTSSAWAIYADVKSASGLRMGTGANFVGVLLSDIPNMTTLQGFSLVTPNVLVLTGQINQTAPRVPVSLFAGRVNYGKNASDKIVFTGQRQFTGSNQADVAVLKNDGGTIQTARQTVSLIDGLATTTVPPVTIKHWLVISE